MKRRLALITEIIAPYRIPVFNALAARDDVDLSVIFLAETDTSLRQWRVYKEDICFAYQVLPSWRRRVAGYNVLLNRETGAMLDRLKPEVVICGGYNYLASWQALWWAKSRRIPFLLWSESNVRDIRSRYRIVEALKKRFLNGCDGFVVPGRASLEYLRELGVDDRPIFTAPNAVDIDFFSLTSRRARENAYDVRRRKGLPERYFLYVGRLVAEKGVFELLEAYVKLGADAQGAPGLVFVGDGVERRHLEARAQEKAGVQVQFFDFAQRDDLAEFYGLAEALVLPTYSDPWGLVVNEAMACALPVIVSKAAGCVEDLVEEGVNGFVVPPGDVAALRTAMQALLDSTELRNQMSLRSVEKIKANSPNGWAHGMAQAARAFPARLT
jgi:glycosyltransferase involved in cell wall biosynthesis